jgi:hypothetical protein
MKMIGFWSVVVVTLLAFGLAGYGGAAYSKRSHTEIVDADHNR